MSSFDSVPPEILSHILSFVGEDLQRCTSRARTPDYQPLLATSLVGRAWTQPSQKQLFSVVHLPEQDPQALRRWVDCPLKSLKTRVLILGGSDSDVPVESMVQAVGRCNGLEVLDLGGNTKMKSDILCQPSLSSLKTLLLTSVMGWHDAGPTNVPFALDGLALLDDQEEGGYYEYSDDLLSAIFISSASTLRSFELLYDYGEREVVAAAFPTFAANLTFFRCISTLPDFLDGHMHLCTSLQSTGSTNFVEVGRLLASAPITTIFFTPDDLSNSSSTAFFLHNAVEKHPSLEKLQVLKIAKVAAIGEEEEWRKCLDRQGLERLQMEWDAQSILSGL